MDVKADTSVLARATYPLAELGYYVYPVSLVDEVFKQNGLTDGNAIRSANIKKYMIFSVPIVFYT
ncbi:lipoprotein [Actinobacillus equuli]|nr:lipoprotein [Actinobacillus equuli]